MLTCVSLKKPHLMREHAVYDDCVDVRLNLGVRAGLSCGKQERQLLWRQGGGAKVWSTPLKPNQTSNLTTSVAGFTSSSLLMSTEMFNLCVYSGCYHLHNPLKTPHLCLLSLEDSSKTADSFPL